jgi:hypothetical protein
LTPVADAEPSTAFSRNQAGLEQMRDRLTAAELLELSRTRRPTLRTGFA